MDRFKYVHQPHCNINFPTAPCECDCTPEKRLLLPNCIDFSTALDMVKSGYKVARAGWNGKGMFIFLVPSSVFNVNRPPLLGIYPEGTEINYHAHIDMKTANGTIVPWLASQADMLADDWNIVE